MYFSRIKSLFIILLCLLGIVFSLPNVIDTSPFLKNKFNLGLDLRGGSYIQFLVDLEGSFKHEMQALIPDIRKKLKKNKIQFSDLKFADNVIRVKLEDSVDLKSVKKIASDLSLIIESTGQDYILKMDPKEKRLREVQKVEQCREVIKLRLDPTGTKEPEIIKQGNNRIVVQLPGVENPEEVKSLLGETGKMSFKMVNKMIKKEEKEEEISPFYEYLPDKENEEILYVIEKEVLLTGDVLKEVKVEQIQGQIGVTFKMNNLGNKKFSDITLNNIGRQLAIIIDDVVVSAPAIKVHIPFGSASIASPSMTIPEATKLKTILSSGSMPAPLKVIEERTVGPSLGADAIKDGGNAVIISMVLVTLFMIAAYSLFGVFACISLLFNLIFLIAGLSLLGATLTLPGIAGIALTIGMAVDANVLIYEAIKEKIKSGITFTKAIVSGFDRAFTTIFDSNLTTLFAFIILYQFGSGPIKGFAVTTSIGIIASMFTALTLTYFQIYLWMGRKKITSLPI